MCATRTIHELPSITRLSFETLLARLTSESCGLSQNELFRLFCQTVREFFGARGVCCCLTSAQGAWRILESAGLSNLGNARRNPLLQRGRIARASATNSEGDHLPNLIAGSPSGEGQWRILRGCCADFQPWRVPWRGPRGVARSGRDFRRAFGTANTPRHVFRRPARTRAPV